MSPNERMMLELETVKNMPGSEIFHELGKAICKMQKITRAAEIAMDELENKILARIKRKYQSQYLHLELTPAVRYVLARKLKKIITIQRDVERKTIQ
jgi:hypothetical protein